MKKYWLLFLAVALALLATPAVVGLVAQDKYEAMLMRLGQTGFKIVEQEYHRGWFESQGSVDLQIVVPSPPNSVALREFRLTLKSNIDHGPLTSNGLALARMETELLVDGERGVSEDYPAEIETLIHLNGGGVTRIDMPQVVFAESDAEPVVSFGGLSGTLEFDAIVENFRIRLDTPGLEVTDKGTLLVKVGEVTMDTHSWQSESGLTLGAGSLILRDLLFQESDTGQKLSMEGLGVKVDSSEQSGEVEGVATYRLEKLETGGKIFGPGILSVKLIRLSASALLSMQQSIEEIQGQSLTEAQRGMALMGIMVRGAPEFLKYSPGIAVESFRLDTPEGVVNAKLSLESAGLQWGHFADPGLWFSKLKAGLSLSMPESLLRSLLKQQARNEIERELEQMARGQDEPVLDPEQLEMIVHEQVESTMEQWLNRGFLKRDGKDVTSIASLTQGQLKVNNESIPLPGMAQ